MNATEIRRTDFTEVTDETLRERVELAKEARRLLNYKHLALQVREGALLETLKRLDIHPLVESSVLEYQQRKTRRGLHLWDGQKIGLFCLAASLATGYLLAYAFHYANAHLNTNLGFVSAMGVVLSPLATVILQIVGWRGVCCKFGDDKRITLGWAKAPVTRVRRVCSGARTAQGGGDQEGASRL